MAVFLTVNTRMTLSEILNLCNLDQKSDNAFIWHFMKAALKATENCEELLNFKKNGCIN